MASREGSRWLQSTSRGTIETTVWEPCKPTSRGDRQMANRANTKSESDLGESCTHESANDIAVRWSSDRNISLRSSVCCVLILAGFILAGLSSCVYDTSSVEVNVRANEPWQTAGVDIHAGDAVIVNYKSGLWRGDIGSTDCPQHGPVGPTCNAVIAPSNYPLPGRPEDSLVGKIGETGEVFFIGNCIKRIAKESGDLYLRINDEDSGLNDNAGFVTVKVSIKSG